MTDSTLRVDLREVLDEMAGWETAQAVEMAQAPQVDHDGFDLLNEATRTARFTQWLDWFPG